MTAIATLEKLLEKPLVTADELLHRPSDGLRYELWEGELRQMPPSGFEHGVVSADIGSPLRNYVRQNNLGVVTGAETGFKVRANPDTVLAPDAAFVSAARLPAGPVRGYFPGAPDLAVEVVSPGDTVQEVDDKVAAWLEFGVKLAWVVRPRRKSVEVHRASGETVLVGAQGELSGEDVVPGFTLKVAEIFS